MVHAVCVQHFTRALADAPFSRVRWYVESEAAFVLDYFVGDADNIAVPSISYVITPLAAAGADSNAVSEHHRGQWHRGHKHDHTMRQTERLPPEPIATIGTHTRHVTHACTCVAPADNPHRRLDG